MAKYDWGDGKGKIHTISKAEHDANLKAKQTPIAPPPGTYDPDLDAQQRASDRGLGDLIDDTGKAKERSATDLQLGLDQIGTGRKRNTEDYTTATGRTNVEFGRSLSDLLTTRTRGGEDYQTSLGNLSRQYQQLGDVQLQAANKAGALEGSGAGIQAARKRAENQSIDKAPIDTAYQRFQADSTRDESRIGEDKTYALGGLKTSYDRGNEDFDTQTGQLGLGYKRGNEDLDTQLTRGGREASMFTQDVAAARQFQYGGPVLSAGGLVNPNQQPGQVGAPPAKGVVRSGSNDGVLLAAPGAPGVKKKKKGRTVTYTTSVGGP